MSDNARLLDIKELFKLGRKLYYLVDESAAIR